MSGTVQSYSLYTPQVFNFNKRISWLTQSNVLRKYKKNENTTLPESICLYRYCKKCKTAKVLFLARKPYCCSCVHEGNNTICHICCYLRAHGLYAVSVVTLMQTVYMPCLLLPSCTCTVYMPCLLLPSCTCTVYMPCLFYLVIVKKCSYCKCFS